MPERALPAGWSTGRRNRWIARDPQSVDPTCGLLFCFAHAGGGGSFYHSWVRALPGIAVMPIVLPGRESRWREPPIRRMAELLPPLCAALEPYADRPYALFGHSLGAIVAYETAQHYAGLGRSPTALVVSGRRPPWLAPARRLSSLDDREVLGFVRALNGTPSEVLSQPSLMRAILPALRADFELNEHYEPGPERALPCPLLAYTGRDDPEVSEHEIRGWERCTAGSFWVRVFSGDHFYLAHGRRDVLAALATDLARLAIGGMHPGVSASVVAGRPPV